MSGDDVEQFFRNLGSILLYSFVAVIVAMLVFEVLNRRYQLMREIFEENSVAAGVFGASFVLGIFYTIAQIVVS
jgi:uncharacterized membrane protein YjfL (UPF0719 family)